MRLVLSRKEALEFAERISNPPHNERASQAILEGREMLKEFRATGKYTFTIKRRKKTKTKS